MLSLQAISAIHNALGDPEVPLSAVDAKAASEGTKQEMSAFPFWNAVNQHQLNESPLLTWKFCHLFHSVLRDGHENVVRDSSVFLSNIDRLCEHWKNSESTDYATCSEIYAKLVAARVRFHVKFTSISGSLNRSGDENDIELLPAVFEQLKNLLELQRRVFHAVDHLSYSSITPQGQCLVAPLAIVVMDTSEFYDHLVKALFRMRNQMPSDAFEDHVSRFQDIYKRIKEFYERSCEMDNLKSRISIPCLSISPNFEAPIDNYSVPEARLLQ